MLKLDRKDTSFVLGEGIAGFPFLFPGQAQDASENDSVGKKYGLEWVGSLTKDSPIYKAVTLVAKTFGGTDWKKFVDGPGGRLRTFEETSRDPAKYPYAVGKYVISIHSYYSPKTFKMEKANFADPIHRERYDRAVEGKAPHAYRVGNPEDPADREIMLQNDSKLIKLMPHEIWAGCYVCVAGHAYWSTAGKPGVKLGLDHVLMIREGERLSGVQSSPDDVFGEYAPSSEMAPKTSIRDLM